MKLLSRAVLVVAICLATASPLHATDQPTGRTTTTALTVDGQRRTYRLHQPRPSTAPVPLVVVLHGAGATAREVERRYHWDRLADRRRFVVAYPQGVDRRWDDTGTRDVSFLRAVLTDVAARVSIDPARVFITGISNGGVMTYRAACDLAGTVAAIGPVAAWFPDCLPAQPIAVIHIHGLADDVLGFNGRPGDDGSGSPSVPDGIAAWRRADGCTDEPVTGGSGEITRTVWRSCASGTAVELDTIEHGQHEWPGAIPKPGNERVSRALDATTTIWDFFEAHPRA